LLFDIDGTLLSGASSAHAEALRAALLSVHGIDVGPLVKPVGSSRTRPGGPSLPATSAGKSTPRGPGRTTATTRSPRSSVGMIRPRGDAAGRTDGEIARLLLLDAGVSADRIDELADDVRAECCRLYAEVCPVDLSDTVIDGIPELLDWLAGMGTPP